MKKQAYMDKFNGTCVVHLDTFGSSGKFNGTCAVHLGIFGSNGKFNGVYAVHFGLPDVQGLGYESARRAIVFSSQPKRLLIHN